MVVDPTSMMRSLKTIVITSTILFSSSGVKTVYCYQRSTSSPATRPTKLSAWEDNYGHTTTNIAPPGRVPYQRTHAESAWEALSSLVRVFRGGAAFVEWNDDGQNVMNSLDRTLRSASVWLAGVVAGQAIASLVDFNEELLHEVCLRV
jgi:hypothetical protein